MNFEEKDVVNEFEDQESYTKNLNQIGFANKKLNLILEPVFSDLRWGNAQKSGGSFWISIN